MSLASPEKTPQPGDTPELEPDRNRGIKLTKGTTGAAQAYLRADRSTQTRVKEPVG
jgi:hypothetical protein